MIPGLLRIAVFSDGDRGGNPAGVLIGDKLPDPETMARIAAGVGYSETAFACREGKAWRVRYFSPASEVPFCGHATIALGAALADLQGDGVFELVLNQAVISVEARHENGRLMAALQSPPTHSEPLPKDLVEELLALFGYRENDLDPAIPPALIHGGANHHLLCLGSRAGLAAMRYDLDAGREYMNREQSITIMLVWRESPRRFHSRNAFASGGVYEDPATGAASAAFAACLRDIGWPHQGSIEIVQGEDMGVPSRLYAEIPDEPGSSIRVSGATRQIEGLVS